MRESKKGNWIGSLLSIISRGRSKVKQKSLLLDLPLDILYALIDALSLPAQIILSQTCRGLWHQMHNECVSTFYAATPTERLKYQATLGELLPDYRLCFACHALHHIDYNDLPTSGVYNQHQPCLALETPGGRYNLHYRYALAFRHVQLAIQYVRREDIHNYYYTALMRRFAAAGDGYVLPVRVRFIAEPVVVRNRFILATTHTYSLFSTCNRQITLHNLSRVPDCFCAHHALGYKRHSDDPFLEVLRLAFRDVARGLNESVKPFSCEQCPTDFTIDVNRKRAIIFAWADLGVGQTPEDTHWRSHTWESAPKFNYEHGSVRKMYYDRLQSSNPS